MLDPDYDEWLASLSEPEDEGAAYIKLPRPISTNNLFANVNGRGRIRSAAYNTWRWQVLAARQPQKPLPKFTAPVSVTFFVGEKGVGNMDADNCAKAYLDALKTHGVIPDDSRKWVRAVTVKWMPDGDGCVARVAPEERMMK